MAITTFYQQEILRSHGAQIDPKDEQIPFNKFKCQRCFLILDMKDLGGEVCPVCHDTASLKKMCRLDHDQCTHEVLGGVAMCDLCGEPVCPECGCHDVEQISRVTGYLQATSGWNAGKMQELKDRRRYNILGDTKTC
jgi:hypothetical protein